MPNSENNHYVKFYRGSAAAWQLLLNNPNKAPDSDTLYFVYDSDQNKNEGKLYLGDRLISAVGNNISGNININQINEISINNLSLADQQLLVYNDIEQVWQNVSVSELKDTLIAEIGNFVGATEFQDGTSGLVPIPLAGDQNSFLRGNSSWTKIDPNVFTFVGSNTLTLQGITQAAIGTIPIKTSNGLQWTNAPIGSLDTREIITLEELQEKIENEDPSINEHIIYMIENNEGTYDEYRVIDGQIVQITNTTTLNLDDYVTKVTFNEKVGVLYDHNDLNTGNLVPGLISRVTTIENNYITQADIGDLSTLQLSEENTTLVDEINNINSRLTWNNLLEN